MNFKSLTYPLLAVFCLLTIVFCPLTNAQPVYQAHTKVDLISDVKTIAPAQSIWIGVRMRMDPEWHVYWRNPGDSGLAPTIAWTLPEGFSAGEIQWPYPKRINVGPLTSFGYEGEVIFWSSITVPANFTSQDKIDITAKVKWLACKVDCIPGQADFVLSLPIGERERNIEGSIALEYHRTLWPIDESPWTFEAINESEQFVLKLIPPFLKENILNADIRGSNADGRGFNGNLRKSALDQRSSALKEFLFFPNDDKLINHAAPQNLTRDGESYHLSLAKSSLLTQAPKSIEGLLVATEGWDGIHRALNVSIPVTESVVPASTSKEISLTLITACLFAFLGGIILNFMPCVLPVLSIKIISLIKSAQDRKKIMASGFVFALGVVVSFWILAGLLIALKAGGNQLGWGFQFQSPVFVAFMAGILFVMGLNLLGVFEIGTSLTAVGQGKVPSGYAGSFWSGVLATVVATPCTAPFMGTAIGFGLSQSALTAFLIFTFLGLGMAAPYVLLCLFPQALRFVPKPGAWMLVLKAIFGFVLLACVIWLVWVLGLQKGIEAIVFLLIGFWFIGLALWIWGTLQRGAKNILLTLLILLLAATGLWVMLAGVILAPAQTQQKQTSQINQIPWKDFSPEEIEKLRAQGKPVFIDFTAAWCLTCQVNDRVVFQNKKVVETFQELGIIAFKADWTNHDDRITRALEGYGKSSIPLYVLYGSKQNDAILLPELVTPEIVIESLKNNIVIRHNDT